MTYLINHFEALFLSCLINGLSVNPDTSKSESKQLPPQSSELNGKPAISQPDSVYTSLRCFPRNKNDFIK